MSFFADNRDGSRRGSSSLPVCYRGVGGEFKRNDALTLGGQGVSS